VVDIIMTEPSPSAEAILKSDNATIEVFRKLLTGGMSSLYLLSFLLTGNRKEARRCFVAGVEGCVDGNRVFKKWATSWARRIVIHNAIQVRSPNMGSWLYGKLPEQGDPTCAGAAACSNLTLPSECVPLSELV